MCAVVMTMKHQVKVGPWGLWLEEPHLLFFPFCTEKCGLYSNSGQLWVGVGSVQEEKYRREDAHSQVATPRTPALGVSPPGLDQRFVSNLKANKCRLIWGSDFRLQKEFQLLPHFCVSVLTESVIPVKEVEILRIDSPFCDFLGLMFGIRITIWLLVWSEKAFCKLKATL